MHVGLEIFQGMQISKKIFVRVSDYFGSNFNRAEVRVILIHIFNVLEDYYFILSSVRGALASHDSFLLEMDFR